MELANVTCSLGELEALEQRGEAEEDLRKREWITHNITKVEILKEKKRKVHRYNYVYTTENNDRMTVTHPLIEEENNAAKKNASKEGHVRLIALRKSTYRSGYLHAD